MGSLRGLERQAGSQVCPARQDILFKHRLPCRTPRGWMSVQEGKVTGKSGRMPGARGGTGKPSRRGRAEPSCGKRKRDTYRK